MAERCSVANPSARFSHVSFTPMALIAVTRLRLRSLRYLPRFAWLAFRSRSEANRTPGHLATRVLNDARFTFWTMSAWDNESSMRAFMLNGAHRVAMRLLRDICDEASVVQWQQDSPTLPEWIEAHRRMVAAGRPSNVLHPSAAHLAGVIAEPRV